MLEGLASKVINNSFYPFIPIVSKTRGGLELAALAAELGIWSKKAKSLKEENEKTFLLAICKTIQIVACLGSMPFFASSKGYFPLAAIGILTTFATHILKSDRDDAYLFSPIRAATFSLNMASKAINSFAIGHMMHQAFFKGQKEGAFMLGTTVAALVFSLSNILNDWNELSLLRGDN